MDFISTPTLVEYDETSEYPLSDAQRLTRLTMAAYVTADTVSDKSWVGANLTETLAGGLGGVSSPLELKEFVDDKASSTQAYVAASSDSSTIVFSVRGSDDLRDWELNYDIPLVDFEPFTGGAPASLLCGPPRAQVTSGLMPSFEALRPLLDKYVLPVYTDKATPTKELIFCGHSRGGATVQLCFAYVLAKISALAPDDLATSVATKYFTLGQPRAANATFRDALEAKCAALRAIGKTVTVWRVVNDRDVVPRIPPMWMGYRHFGTVALYVDQPDGTSKLCLRAALDHKSDAIPSGQAAPGKSGAGTISLMPVGMDVAQLITDHTSYDAQANSIFERYLGPGQRKGFTLLEVLAVRSGGARITVQIVAPPGPLQVVFGKAADGETCLVRSVKETSPLAGQVVAGDVVLAVDGEGTADHSYLQLVEHLKAKISSSRTLTISRAKA